MKPVCLITGASGRLGHALCCALQNDYELVATYRSNMPKLQSQDQRCLVGRNKGVNVTHPCHGFNLVQADLTCRDDMRKLVEETMTRYGRIDVLINSAADVKFHGNLRDLWYAEDHPQTQMLLNSIVPMQLASAIYQSCWKHHADENRRRNCSVVNVSSISGLYVLGEHGQAFYGASKAAMNWLTLYLSLEMARYGVRVNAICPSRFVGAAQTRRVTEAIRELLTGDMTGTIVKNVP